MGRTSDLLHPEPCYSQILAASPSAAAAARLALYRILIKLDSSAKTTKGHKYC
jgi:hypothetical protein